MEPIADILSAFEGPTPSRRRAQARDETPKPPKARRSANTAIRYLEEVVIPRLEEENEKVALPV